MPELDNEEKLALRYRILNLLNHARVIEQLIAFLPHYTPEEVIEAVNACVEDGTIGKKYYEWWGDRIFYCDLRDQYVYKLNKSGFVGNFGHIEEKAVNAVRSGDKITLQTVDGKIVASIEAENGSVFTGEPRDNIMGAINAAAWEQYHATKSS